MGTREPGVMRPSSAKSALPLLQRKSVRGCCVQCGATQQSELQRRSTGGDRRGAISSVTPDVPGSSGSALDPGLQTVMGARFSHDFSTVRIHNDTRAAESARALNALAYTVGNNVVFAAGRYAPGTSTGRSLIAHELAHVVQQAGGNGGIDGSSVAGSSALEASAAAAADAALAGRPATVSAAPAGVVQRRAAPFIKKVTVHLAPAQSAELEWEGTPPADATGSNNFTVSTGKGYGDPDDPPGTCLRDCCSDPITQCAPPWNRPDRVGACCTYYGNNFWTGTPKEEHNTWKWWTPIQPWYSSRGIALHQHPEVTGQPIGHGCVRMDEANAKRIYDYSNGRRTNVTIDGRAAPVACDAARHCGASAGAGSEDRGNTGDGGDRQEHIPHEQVRADARIEAVPGLEGAMS